MELPTEPMLVKAFSVSALPAWLVDQALRKWEQDQKPLKFANRIDKAAHELSMTTPTTFTLNTNTTSYLKPARSEMFNTRTVKVIDGYIGQITSEGEVVWQSKSYKSEEKARKAADRAKATGVRGVFAHV